MRRRKVCNCAIAPLKMRKNFSNQICICTTLIPGGIGFSEPLYQEHELLMHRTRKLIATCECAQGCPSCVGPAGDLAPRAKEAALAILERLGAFNGGQQ